MVPEDNVNHPNPLKNFLQLKIVEIQTKVEVVSLQLINKLVLSSEKHDLSSRAKIINLEKDLYLYIYKHIHVSIVKLFKYEIKNLIIFLYMCYIITLTMYFQI